MYAGGYASSLGSYEAAIAIDPAFGFIPAYNMAYALVRQQNRYAEDYNDNAPAEVAGHLTRSLEHIQNVHIPQTQRILQTLQCDPGSPLAQAVQAKLDIIQTHAAYSIRPGNPDYH